MAFTTWSLYSCMFDTLALYGQIARFATELLSHGFVMHDAGNFADGYTHMYLKAPAGWAADDVLDLFACCGCLSADLADCRFCFTPLYVHECGAYRSDERGHSTT